MILARFRAPTQTLTIKIPEYIPKLPYSGRVSRLPEKAIVVIIRQMSGATIGLQDWEKGGEYSGTKARKALSRWSEH